MKTLKLTLALLLIAIGTSVQAANDYATIATKAERFFSYQEWNSALAMYELMLSERPQEATTYSSACVASGVVGDSIKQISLMERAERNAIPIDTLLSQVRTLAVSINRPHVYTSFIDRVRKAQPWTARMLSVRLLDFYEFRNDADNIILTAQQLLRSTPDNINFITAMAEAYNQKGEYAEACQQYESVLALDSNNINALLYLGVYYDSCGEGEKALPYLRRAYAVQSTPYLRDAIARLERAVNAQ